MIRVRFTADAVYRQAAGDVTYVAGSTHDFEDDHARRWLRRGMAVQIAVRPVIASLQTEPTLPPVPVDPAPVAETAIAEPETAIADPEPAPAAPPATLSLRGRPRR